MDQENTVRGLIADSIDQWDNPCLCGAVNGIQGSMARTDDTINALDWTNKAALDIIGLGEWYASTSSH